MRDLWHQYRSITNKWLLTFDLTLLGLAIFDLALIPSRLDRWSEYTLSALFILAIIWCGIQSRYITANRHAIIYANNMTELMAENDAILTTRHSTGIDIRPVTTRPSPNLIDEDAVFTDHIVILRGMDMDGNTITAYTASDTLDSITELGMVEWARTWARDKTREEY
ncbi:hypothetical protein [Corynebacterium phoceense]|uniref:hypothetical protein n=1 Tax=Corynebacterium phoceense TaxID=1686286 RepID=UPI0018AC7ADA|nr:hypothetical protein [Corynebacterium phoceense]MBF9011300.1 hypothetical protein [Corynebacterium phoceense]